jgi:large conductance mechanosensitive channel
MHPIKSFIEEFKKFAMRGNVIDLAVGIVIGAAFQKIVTSLVNNIITPLIGSLMGGVDFTGYTITVRESEIAYGIFIQSIIDFVIVAFAIFIAIKVMNKLQQKEAEKPEEKKEVEPSEEVKLLREIRDSLRKEPSA